MKDKIRYSEAFKLKVMEELRDAKWKSVKEAATAYGIAEMSVYNWMHKLAFANAAKDYANSVIRGYMQPGEAGKFTDNIHKTLRADANRAIYILNGTVYEFKPADELLPAFKALVPDPKKQKAISSWINQLCMNTIISPSCGLPYATGVDAIHLPDRKQLIENNLFSARGLTPKSQNSDAPPNTLDIDDKIENLVKCAIN